MKFISWILASIPVLATAHHSHNAPQNFSTDVTSIGHSVIDLDKTLQFYNEVLGLKILSRDHTAKKDHVFSVLTNTEQASYKTAVVQIPNQNWTLKLTQYYGLTQSQPIAEHEQDPATPALTLTVKNATAINNVLRAANVSTLTGQPIPVGTGEGTTSTVFIYDPDGYILECVQRSGPSDYFTVPPPTDLDFPYVIRGQLDLTVGNISQALHFYKDILGLNISAGFEPLIGPGYAPIGPLGGIFDIPSNVSWAAATGNCDADTRCEFYEYDDPNRVAIIRPIQDFGIGWTAYVVRELDSVLEAVKKKGQKVVTSGGKPVEIDGMRSVMIRDPSGYLIRLDQIA